MFTRHPRVIHKRKIRGHAYSLCGAWNVQNMVGNRWIDWEFTRYQWALVTCVKCLRKISSK